MPNGIAKNRNILKITKLAQTSMKLWGLHGNLKLLGQSENIVFEVDGKIIRITEKNHRTMSELQAELDFISMLSDNKISVAKTYKSNNGNDIETIDGFYISVFEKAKGEVKKVEDVFSSLDAARNLGREIGKMHLTINNHNIKNPIKRHMHEDTPYNKDGLDFISNNDSFAIQEFKKARNWLLSLPKDKDAYNLIHLDAHAGNFCVDENSKITLFDFDDCAYSFFAYDLAIPLNHLKYSKLTDLEKDTARAALLEGYAEEYKLSQRWIDMINNFIRYRNIEMYIWECMMFGVPKKGGKELGFKTYCNIKYEADDYKKIKPDRDSKKHLIKPIPK